MVWRSRKRKHSRFCNVLAAMKRLSVSLSSMRPMGRASLTFTLQEFFAGHHPWKDKLPQQVSAVVDEVSRALQTDSPRLATIGARTIVDLVILDKVGDVGSFGEKLAALEAQGYVGRKNREFVSAALEAGSAAAHRGVAPQVVDLNRVIDIVESLLEAVYVLEDAAKHLRKTTPPRPGRSKRDG